MNPHSRGPGPPFPSHHTQITNHISRYSLPRSHHHRQLHHSAGSHPSSPPTPSIGDQDHTSITSPLPQEKVIAHSHPPPPSQRTQTSPHRRHTCAPTRPLRRDRGTITHHPPVSVVVVLETAEGRYGRSVLGACVWDGGRAGGEMGGVFRGGLPRFVVMCYSPGSGGGSPFT